MNRRSFAIGLLMGYGLNYLLLGIGLHVMPVSPLYQVIIGGVFLLVGLGFWLWYDAPWRRGD